MNKSLASLFVFFVMSAAVSAAEFDTEIAMFDKGAATFYVPGHITGVGRVELMVDTGSSYTAINQEALALLCDQGKARYVKRVGGQLANGETVIVPIYRISELRLGECVLNDVEAAVLPGKTRFILGLSALEKAAPFIFSVSPPTLVLSNCAACEAGRQASGR